MISKICLSLKSIDGIDFPKLSKLIRNIEFRLDYINFDFIELEKLSHLFDYIIIKINDLSQVLKINEYIVEKNLSNNIIYDIDLNIFNKYNIIKYNILNDYNYILSLHNIKYSNLINIYNQIELLYNIYNFSYLKAVINDTLIKYEKKLLVNVYNQLQNSNFYKIIFFEGDNFLNSRYHSILLGAPFLYCSIDSQSRTGLGQPTLDEAIRMMKLLRCLCKNKQTDNKKNSISQPS